jgi:hypothetical protein
VGGLLFVFAGQPVPMTARARFVGDKTDFDSFLAVLLCTDRQPVVVASVAEWTARPEVDMGQLAQELEDADRASLDPVLVADELADALSGIEVATEDAEGGQHAPLADLEAQVEAMQEALQAKGALIRRLQAALRKSRRFSVPGLRRPPKAIPPRAASGLPHPGGGGQPRPIPVAA